ncbi:MAG: hypothetical protein KBD52_00760 [Candidatus Pacebacteria bacterium]|nr:hypothetical protein [Candidatus Paceibacterota bacterium]
MKDKIIKKIKKILPSKKFIRWLLIGIGILIFIFFVFFAFSKEKNFLSKNHGLETTSQTVMEIVQTDTDLDGVMDWEESLWGTDKNNKITFDNIPDSTFIENKKKELKIEGEQNLNQEAETETDKFAKEFFSSFTALKSSGTDSATIESFSNALGQKIVNPTLVDRYKEEEATLGTTDSSEYRANYYLALKKIFEKYKDSGLGSELDIVTNGLLTYDSSGVASNYDDLVVIADAYQEFASETMKVSVPKSLLKYHLNITNGANNTGISVFNMAKVINDPIVGLSGISQYQKYVEEFVNAVEDLENVLDL